MNEFWIQFFACCGLDEQNDPRVTKKRRIRIDRTMIGNPSNFVHTAHLGSESQNFNYMENLQRSMSSKGGYDLTAMPVNIQMKVINVQQ